METKIIEAKSILSPQKGGFLSVGPHPFTHTLSPYTGCGFGNTYCGSYCYAPNLPSWKFGYPAEKWGGFLAVKMNAASVLRDMLVKMTPESRNKLRIFMSPATDPWQPAENLYEVTRRCLDVFSEFDDLGLLVMQTRSPLLTRDIGAMQRIPYLWLSVTVETDLEESIGNIGKQGSLIKKRIHAISTAQDYGLNTQIAVSPCLPYSKDFADLLTDVNPNRVVVDNFVVGDGSRGDRTAGSPFAQNAAFNWRDQQPSLDLFHKLQDEMGEDRVGWSSPGFCGIPSRPLPLSQMSLFDE